MLQSEGMFEGRIQFPVLDKKSVTTTDGQNLSGKRTRFGRNSAHVCQDSLGRIVSPKREYRAFILLRPFCARYTKVLYVAVHRRLKLYLRRVVSEGMLNFGYGDDMILTDPVEACHGCRGEIASSTYEGVETLVRAHPKLVPHLLHVYLLTLPARPLGAHRTLPDLSCFRRFRAETALDVPHSVG